MSDWTKVEREKEDWTRIDRETIDYGWFRAGWFTGWFSGPREKVEKPIDGWTKVTKE
ncbi:hypothetical protein ES705_26304 [subsurface metagenome]